MTEPRQLSDEISVCAFVPPEKLAELAPKFRTIINNRPDSEEPGQPAPRRSRLKRAASASTMSTFRSYLGRAQRR